MNAMITVEEALARVIASGAPPLEEETVGLEQAYGRVLVRDLKALRTQPPFPNSAMDGYALRAADTTPAPARRCVFSPARRCRPGPIPSSFRRMLSARRSASGFRARRRPATICVRPAWISATPNPSFRPAAASAP